MAVVRLNLTLIDLAHGKKELVIAEHVPVSLKTILGRLGVPEEEVGIIVRNRKTDDIDCIIGKEDVVELFPILSGG